MNAREEIAKTEAIAQEVRDTLQAIGPAHPLFRDLMDELNVLDKQLKDLKKLLP